MQDISLKKSFYLKICIESCWKYFTLKVSALKIKIDKKTHSKSLSVGLS